MTGFLKRLWDYEPVILAWALSGGLAVLLGNVIHISSTQEAAVTTVLTGLVTIFTAVKTRPTDVQLIVGGLVTIATAAAAFGLHLNAAQIGAGSAVLSGILALVLPRLTDPLRTRPDLTGPNLPRLTAFHDTPRYRTRPCHACHNMPFQAMPYHA
jgi:hypothetical protein